MFYYYNSNNICVSNVKVPNDPFEELEKITDCQKPKARNKVLPFRELALPTHGADTAMQSHLLFTTRRLFKLKIRFNKEGKSLA